MIPPTATANLKIYLDEDEEAFSFNGSLLAKDEENSITENGRICFLVFNLIFGLILCVFFQFSC